MKRFILFTFVMLLLTGISNGQKIDWINFEWEKGNIGSQYFDKLAILIPIQVEGLPYKFNAQFDLGAPVTMFYGQSFAPVLSAHETLKNKIDTSITVWLQSTKNPVIKDVGLSLNNISFGRRDVALFKDYGDTLTADSLKTNTTKHIGTIGADLFNDKVLIIDYPRNRMAVVDQVFGEFMRAEFLPMKVDDGRIKIPFSIGGNTHYVMFDTGSSIFELTTDEENLKYCIKADAPIIDTIQVSSWGSLSYMYGREINNLAVGGKSFPKAKVYESKGEDRFIFHNNEKIIGITGNSLFINNTLIIDYKNRRFGIL